MLIRVTSEFEMTFGTFADVTYRCQHAYDLLPGAASLPAPSPRECRNHTHSHPFSSLYLFSIECRMGKTINQLSSLSFASPSAGQPPTTWDLEEAEFIVKQRRGHLSISDLSSAQRQL